MASTKTNSTTNSKQESYSNTSTSGGSTSNTSSHTEGSSHSVTRGYSDTTSHSEGGANSLSAGKSYASGQISDATQAGFNKYTQDYVQSEAVANAYNNLQAAANNKPTFQSTYADKLSNLYDQIMNRDKFSYNFNEDSMYQMYKDQYIDAGKNAMQDTMGQAAKLTGGYGSSYSQTAGQQTYQNYLQQLNNIIPELRQQAYEEYQAEGNELLNKYNITNDAYNNEYGQYRDSVSDWQADRSFNQSAYQDERNFDYGQYSDNRNFWQNEYWQEKNAEQSNIQETNQTNWNDANSHTNSYSETDTNYSSDTNSTTNTSNWSNSTTNGWTTGTSTTNGTSNSTGTGSTKTSNARKGETDTWRSYSAASSDERQGFISDLAEKFVNNKEDVYKYLRELSNKGTTGSQGQSISFHDNDIASIYRSLLSATGQGGANYSNDEILKIVGIRK